MSARALTPSGGPGLEPRPEALVRRERQLLAFVAFAAVVVSVTSVLRLQANPVLAAMVGILVIAAWHRVLLAWPAVLAYVLLVILFIPIRRFTVGGGLPVALEPYRLLILLVLIAWGLALLVDPRTRWHRTNLEAPLIGFVSASLGSLVLNLRSILAEGIVDEVLKQVTFFASFLLVMYLASSVLRTRMQVDRVIKVLVVGGSAVALSSVVEWRTGINIFNHIQRVLPLLHVDPDVVVGPPERGGRVRAYASAQHPIALGAALVLLLPLAVYLFRRTRQPLWMAAAALLTLGALATGSRTAALMLMVELVAFFWVKRAETIRLLPMLVPLLVVCQIMMPGTLGTFRAILFPEQGLIAEQKGGEGGSGSGRIADLGPSLQEWSHSPFVGAGFGTRLTSETDSVVNARILDNEWLGILLEVGALGLLSLVWLYVRAVRRLARRARRDPSEDGWLLACLCTSLCAFAIGMLTYDAFSFIQVTFLSFILLGLAAVALRVVPAEPPGLDRAAGSGLADGLVAPADVAPGRP